MTGEEAPRKGVRMMRSALEKMEQARGILILARDSTLDRINESSRNSISLVAPIAVELTSILQAIDALEKVIAEERSGGNVYTIRGAAGS
jgi:hypothetical protein